MADIFISYKRTDVATAVQLAKLFEQFGWSVWWDSRLTAGEQWDVAIEREIKLARCVVVIWSPDSIDPVSARWVHTEAHEGLQRNILVPVLIRGAAPPFAFKLIQTSDLSIWSGSGADAAVNPAIVAVRTVLDRTPVRPSPAPAQTIATASSAGTFGRYVWGSASSIGSEEHQEDKLLIWHRRLPPRMAMMEEDAQLLALIADGMGYEGSGQLASRCASEGFVGAYVGMHEQPTRERLRAGLAEANGAIALQARHDPRARGMGSTLMACTFDQSGCQWISVGDNVLLLYRDGEVARVTEDHSLAPLLDELARAGRITRAEALSDPRRYQLRAALTGDDIALVDLSTHPLVIEPGDIFVLASASLNAISEDEVSRIVSAYMGDGVQGVADALVRSVVALCVPKQPNLTVAAIRVADRSS